jgi:hypothetical protein
MQQPFEPQTHSFLVRYWREQAVNQAGQQVWRGHVTHVASGARRYIQHHSEVVPFIGAYLQPPDQAPTRRQRLGQWFRRLWPGRNRKTSSANMPK